MNPTHPPVPPPPAGPSTREIPLVSPGGAAAGSGGASAASAAAAAPRATGPVDYVPGPPPAGPAAPPTAEVPAGPDATRGFVVDLSDEPRARRTHPGLRAGALLLGIVAAGVLELGLLMHGGGVSLWSRTPLWSAFASLAVVAGLAGVAGRLAGNRPAARPIALAGLGGLAVFWLLVVLRTADTDRGFLLTAALGCLIGAVWVTGRADGAEPIAEPTV